MSDARCPLPHAYQPERPRTPDHGLRICRGHAKALPDRILTLAQLHTELAANLCNPGGHGEKVSGTADVGLKLNTTVADLRHAIKNELAGWCRIVCEDRDVSPPDSDDATSLARFLVTHCVWISTQPWVEDLWAALVHDPTAREREVSPALTSRARAVLSPSGTRKAELGEVCPDCGGGLLVMVRDEDDTRPSDLWCEQCGRNWRPEEWLRLGKRIRGVA